ncbi:hypothetical protein OS175_04145 [Marinicella sp. S1101]|uniref:hypothetical protein n=1 Tax=Marinicella marina TaxID=2996016 RepID=UPI002260FF97|nr:hypothetical protein [Marinicella marina]MCX7553058.1 hypothetical protein [Marinicella marina]MDJ1139582.1 hypothetical protein [Marinicella marina]
MWLFIKSLFMIKDRSIAKEMVASQQSKNTAAVKFRLSRLMRRRARRNKFKAHINTQLSYKVK